MQAIHKRKAALAALLAAAALAQQQHGHADFCAPETKATPVLSTSDFTELDRQLAAACQGTKAYRNIRSAIRAGFVPWTPSFHGHGTHWVQRPEKGSLGYAFDPGGPKGSITMPEAACGLFSSIPGHRRPA
ncbi:hypothetical protein F2P45_30620 [Massilia sp. CCM 8733]|uniref:Uncharacterized protein n=1 Tax=Massilia mucilaginosa TaxID=2609282 RepID=A0ABX0P382_9BURK|nr:hypothetical protein [Massilia mucilaginosa]NHZ93331.1 hypothetical protein [Massilia mucilaginosa]